MNREESVERRKAESRLEDLVVHPRLFERLLNYAQSARVSCRLMDPDGNWIGEPVNQDLFCSMVCSTARGQEGCLEGCRRQLVEADRSTGPVVFRCSAGVSEVIAAIRADGEVIGYICGPRALEAPLGDGNLEALAAFASQVDLTEKTPELTAAAQLLPILSEEALIESAHELQVVVALQAQRVQQERQMRVVEEAAKRLERLSSRAEIRETILDAMEALFGDARMCIYLLEKDGRLHPFGSRREAPETAFRVVEVGEGHIGWVVEHNAPFLPADLEARKAADPMFLGQDGEHSIQSVLTVPLRGENRAVVGALQVFSPERNAFQRSDIQPLEVLANCSGVVLERAQQEADFWAGAVRIPEGSPWAEKWMELMTRKPENGGELTQARRELYGALVAEAMRITGAQRGSVRLFDATWERLYFFVTGGPGWTEEIKNRVYRLDQDSACAHAVKTRQLYPINDVRRAEHFKPVWEDVRSHVSLAIFLGDRIVAVLSLDATGENAFTQERCSELVYLAAQCSSVLSHFDLWEDHWLFDLETLLPTIWDVHSLCAGAVSRVQQLFGVRGCSIFLQYPGSHVLRLAATTSIRPNNGQASSYQIGQGMTGWVAKHLKPLRIRHTANEAELAEIADDLKREEHWREAINYDDVAGRTTWLAAPMAVRGKLVGVIRLTIKENRADFEVGDEILLGRVADRLALSIENIWLKQEEKRRLEQLKALVELGNLLSGTLVLQKVCRIILEQGSRILGCSCAHIRLLDTTTGDLKLAMAVGSYKDLIPRMRRRGEGISGVVAEEGLRRIVPDVSKNPHYLSTIAKETGQTPEAVLQWLQSKACLPLIIQNELVGTLCFHWNHRPAFETGELKLMDDLAYRSALAIKAAQMHQEIEGELKQKIESLGRLREIGIRFAQTPDLDILLKDVLAAAMGEAQVGAGATGILDEQRNVLVVKAAEKATEESLAPQFMPEVEIRGDLRGRIARLEKAWHLPDAAKEPEFQEFLGQFADTPQARVYDGIASALIIPIRLKDRCLGLLVLVSRDPRCWLDSTIEFLGILAAEAAVAIENARLHEEERARRLEEPLIIMGSMLGSFNHNMRNPIQTISAALEDIAHRRFDPVDLPRRTAQMRAAVDKLAGICEEVGMFASGRAAGTEAVDLNEVLRTSVRESDLQRHPQIECSVRLAEPAPMVRGNRVQLEHCMRRIIENAIEAMPKGGHVLIETDSADTTIVRFWDSGVGMDAATKARAFDPFFTTKASRDGKGLGLSVVFGIMRVHAGRVTIDSEPGAGTTVALHFPRVEGGQHAESAHRG